MKQFIKSVVARSVGTGVALMRRSRLGRFAYAEIITGAMSRTMAVSHNDVSLMFAIPNAQNAWRAETFSTKEPETLEWLDSLERGSVLWDIGANVGLYSCYAAKARGCRVFAFEPSVFNLELLARNVHVNALASQVTIVPLALSDKRSVAMLNMTSTEWGGALSTFGQSYGHDGQPLAPIFEFQTIGLSMADAIGCLGIPSPDHLKIDVDGIEHLILQGGASVLGRVRSVLIEVNDEFAEQASGCAEALRQAGLMLTSKRHSAIVDAEREFRKTFNQIWTRPHAQTTHQVG